MCAASRPLQYEVDIVATQKQGKLVEGKVRSHTLLIDQPELLSGTDKAPNPLETYAFSLGACLVSAMRFVGGLEGLPISNIQARVQGTVYSEKAMEGEKTWRAGFPELAIDVRFDAPWSEKEKRAFVERVVARCPICDNTSNSTPLHIVVTNE